VSKKPICQEREGLVATKKLGAIMIKAAAKATRRVKAPPLVPSEPATTSSPVIDLIHLRRMTLGEKSLEAEVLALFDRQADMLLTRMEQAAPAAVGAFAHTIKGSARGIGAWRVAEAAEAVERAAAGSADVAGAIGGLATAIDEARNAIADLLAAQ
jgi:HPt (histidine-containing phosphotransfer) domain-containing protein